MVGRGRPPREARWKPGQSGNPKGQSFDTFFTDALNQKLKVQDGGRSRTITVREGIVRRLTLDALRGDSKAISLLLAHEPEISRFNEPNEIITRGMDPNEAMKIYARIVTSRKNRD